MLQKLAQLAGLVETPHKTVDPVQEAQDLLADAFENRGSTSKVDWNLVRRIRPRYAEILDRAGCSPTDVVNFYLECAETIPQSPTRRRQNDFFAITGRPLERGFRTRALPEPMNIACTQTALDRAAGQAAKAVSAALRKRQWRRVEASHADVVALCGVTSDLALRSHREMIVALVRQRRWQDAASELRLYTDRGGALFDEENCGSPTTLSLLNAMFSVTRACVAEPTWKAWAFGVLGEALEGQKLAMKSDMTDEERAGLAEAMKANQDALEGWHTALERLSLEAAPKSDQGEVETDSQLERRLLALRGDDPVRKFGLRMLRNLRTGTPDRQNDAREKIEWLLRMPLMREDAVSSGTRPSLGNVRELCLAAEQALQKRVIGHAAVKESLLRRLSVLLSGSKGMGFTLMLTGEPGVGKTSMAEAIASAFKRRLVTISAETFTHRADVSGDRAVWTNSDLGDLARALLSGDDAPVILIDEIGKAGLEAQQALMRYIEQGRNDAVPERFLGGIPLDFSRVIFVLTANKGEPLIPPLQDRCLIKPLGPLSSEEKSQILQKVYDEQTQSLGLATPLTFRAKSELLRWRADEPGARGLTRDVEELVGWLQLQKVRNGTQQAAARVDDVKAVVEQTVATVEPWPEKNGLIADITLGGAQRPGIVNAVVFNASNGVMRLTLDDSGIGVERLQGEDVVGTHGIGIADVNGTIRHAAMSAQGTVYSAKRVVCTFESFVPPLPPPGSHQYDDLFNDDGVLRLTLAISVKDGRRFTCTTNELRTAIETPLALAPQRLSCPL